MKVPYSYLKAQDPPKGYRLKKEDFQKHILFSPSGELLGEFQFKAHAVNRAYRHERGLGC